MLKPFINYLYKQASNIFHPGHFLYTKAAKRTFSTKKTYMMQRCQWEALYRFYLFEYILEFQNKNELKNFKSIREGILQLNTFQQFMLGKINLKTGNNYSALQEIGFNMAQIEDITKAFDINHGIYVPSVVFEQDRFSEGRYKTLKTILNPQLHSISILKKLIGSQSKGIFHGQKGVGKSFTYLLYSFLTDKIVSCRINRQIDSKNNSELVQQMQQNSSELNAPKSDNKTLFQLIPQKQFNQFPYLIYFPIKYIFAHKLSQAKQSLLIQAPYEMNIKQFEKEKVSTLQSFVNFAQKYFSAINHYFFDLREPIQRNRSKFFQQKEQFLYLTIVIDEAEEYYHKIQHLEREFSNYKKQSKKYKYQPYICPSYCEKQQISKEYEMIYQCSRFLKAVSNNSRIIFNTPQHIQNDIIISFNITYHKDLFNIKYHQKGTSGDLKINCTKSLLKEEGTRQLYTIFWFQIQKILNIQIKLDQKRKKQTIHQLKSIFCRVFSLFDHQQPLKWKKDVRQLNIRNALENYTKHKYWIKAFSEIKYNENKSQQTVQLNNWMHQQYIFDIFHGMKRQIERNRYFEIQNVFERYLQNSHILSPREVRYQILLNFELKLKEKIIEQENHKEKHIVQIQNNILQISYAQFYNKYRSQSENDTIIYFPQQAGIGTMSEDSDKTISFILSKNNMSDMLEFMAFYQQQFAYYYRKTAFKASAAMAKHLLDKVCLFVFSTNNFTLSFDNKAKNNGEIFEIKVVFDVIKAEALKPIYNFQSQFSLSILDQMIKQAKQNPGKTFLGYNRCFLKNKLKEIDDGYFYRSKNAFYDCILIEYDEGGQKVTIRLIDATINYDLQKYLTITKKLRQKLEEYKTFQEIFVQFCILTPSYKLKHQKNESDKLIPYLQETFLNQRQKKSYGLSVLTFDQTYPLKHMILKKCADKGEQIAMTLLAIFLGLQKSENTKHGIQI